ncbi:MAG: GNAT family N-acetyltransferase [Pseudomonadota bacterium]
MTHLYPLRAFHPEDCAAMAILHSAAILAVSHRFYSKRQLQSWAYGLDASSYERITAGEEHCAVCEDPGGALCGFCSFQFRSDGDGQIASLYVHPDQQGFGIGARLLLGAERDLAANNISTIVIEASLSAVPFYLNHGYLAEHRGQSQTRGGLSIPVRWMRKALAA